MESGAAWVMVAMVAMVAMFYTIFAHEMEFEMRQGGKQNDLVEWSENITTIATIATIATIRMSSSIRGYGTAS